MKLTDEQKRANRVEKTLERFQALRIHKCIGEVARLFQKLVRMRAVESDGKLTCCSCGKRDYPGKPFDAGHWIGRSSRATIFDERNCHPQCVGCNQYGIGNVKQGYDEFMRKKYGQEVMDELVRLSNTTRSWTREELAELYVQYQEELKQYQ